MVRRQQTKPFGYASPPIKVHRRAFRNRVKTKNRIRMTEQARPHQHPLISRGARQS